MDKIALNFVGKSTVFLLLLEPSKCISPHFSQNDSTSLVPAIPSFLASCAECYDTKADVLLRQKSDPSLPPLISRYLIPTCFPFTSKPINETQVVCHDFRKRYCFVFS